MKKWEYKISYESKNHRDDLGTKRDYLDSKGEEGWELVTILESIPSYTKFHEVTGYTYIFKREQIL